tara:strand:+ start:8052 stop:8573 length:522 start_codon:yes stop_codon:yes gene_type:complete
MTSILKVTEIQDPANSNAALTIDSSGRVSFPQIPCACVTLTTSNTQDTSNPYTITNADILFDKVTINQGSVYDSSNGRFTAPITGIYEVAYSFLKDDDSGGNVTYVRVRKNDSDYTEAGGTLYDYASNAYSAMSMKLLINLNASQYISFRMVSGAIHLNSDGQYHSVVFKLVG